MDQPDQTSVKIHAAPPFAADVYTPEERELLAPFFTNLDQSVYSPLIFSPEVIGALCSRTSRAAGDLRKIFLEEYIRPFIEPARAEKESDTEWTEKVRYGEELHAFIDFLHAHPPERVFSNPRARSFYSKWLAQYGDDSIAQMAGVHLVFSSISQLAIKHFEDQRIGLAPIEKSTRYVDFSHKINAQYAYYVDPELKGLAKEYQAAMDGLFDTYCALKPRLAAWLHQHFPDEKPKVVEAKSFDTLRGLLPLSTLSQVAFFGNGQAFEYMIARSLKSRVGEIRWVAERAYEELFRVVPSFLRRLKASDPSQRAAAEQYQEYKAGHADRMLPLTAELLGAATGTWHSGPTVRIVEYDPAGEAKVIAGLLYGTATNHRSWDDLLTQVQRISTVDQERILAAALTHRTQRWQKVHRAFENVYVRCEVTMNIGAWRDLHRHRMLTQQRQYFTVEHGFDIPLELTQAGLAQEYTAAIQRAEGVYATIASHSSDIAQYAVTLAHRVRFMQWKNLRECFWELELRTIPEGHPDYRIIEQGMFRQLEHIYPLIAKHMRVNMNSYDFARRGQEEKIKAKLTELSRP